jgi:hypothetical protein
MPTHRQIKVQPPVRTFGLGTSSTADLTILYSGSPVNDGSLSDVIVEEFFQEENQAPVISDGGHTFGTINRDYQDSPNLADVEVGGGGKPGSPFGPNIAVAPTDPHNPAGIPEAGVEATENSRGGGGAFVGNGLESPSRTSAKIGARRIGDLIFGRSSREP